MPQTKIVVTYSPRFYRHRGTHFPGDDSEVPALLASIASISKSRLAVAVLDRGMVQTLGIEAALQAHTGHAPIDDRCMVVSGNTVVEVLHGDPAIDLHPAGRLIHDPTGTAAIGDKVVNGLPVKPIQTGDSGGKT